MPSASVLLYFPACMILLVGGGLTAVYPLASSIAFFIIAIAMVVISRPVIGFHIIYMWALLSNFNFIYNSPIRIFTEQYPVIIFPLTFLTVVALASHIVKKDVFTTQKTEVQNVLVFFFWAWMLSTLFWTMDIYHGINVLYNLTIGIVVYLLTIHFIKDQKTLERTLKLLLPWGILLGVLLVISTRIDETKLIQERLTSDLILQLKVVIYGKRPGGFASPQIAGSILTFIIFMGIAIFPKLRFLFKCLLIPVAAFFISDIFATGSKGAAGAFILGVMFLLVFHPKARKRIYYLAPLFFGFIVMVFIFNVLVLASDRLASGADVNQLSLTLRLDFWKTGLNMLSERIIGAGVGGFARLVDPWPGAHSYYFSILFDLGVVGLLIWIGFISIVLFRLLRAVISTPSEDYKHYLCCMTAMLVVVFIHATVDFPYDSGYIWLVYGTVIATIRLAEPTFLSKSREERPEAHAPFLNHLCEERLLRPRSYFAHRS